jgi:hypothetical protein
MLLLLISLLTPTLNVVSHANNPSQDTRTVWTLSGSPVPWWHTSSTACTPPLYTPGSTSSVHTSSTAYIPPLYSLGATSSVHRSSTACIPSVHSPGATIGSEVVANSILQLPNPWASAYNPSRFLLGFSAAVKVMSAAHITYHIFVSFQFDSISDNSTSHCTTYDKHDLFADWGQHVIPFNLVA